MSMNRRRFLQQVTAWYAGLTLIPPVFRIVPGALGADEAAMPLLAVGKGEDYAALVARVLGPLGGIQAFVKPGHRVVVKPNIGWDRPPELAANTHPQVVQALVKLCLEAGARQVMVFDRPCNTARLTYRHSGIEPAVSALGDGRATCPFIDDRKFVPVRIEQGKVMDQWQFYKDALEADCYINVPIAKHHGLSRLTLGLKNVMGVLGGNRGQIHSNIAEKLVDLNTVVAPKLTIIDATRVLLRNGPSGGNINDVKVLNTLVASADIVAADAYATTLFGLKPMEIGSTAAAHARGMGQMDLEKVKIIEV